MDQIVWLVIQSVACGDDASEVSNSESDNAKENESSAINSQPAVNKQSPQTCVDSDHGASKQKH